MENANKRIRVKCPACGKQYQLLHAAIGKSAKCGCGNSFVVAAPPATKEEPAAPKKSAKELAAALASLIEESEKPITAIACVHHPDQPAACRCLKCRQPVCRGCALRTSNGKNVCRGCAEKIQAKRTATTPVDVLDDNVADALPATANSVPATPADSLAALDLSVLPLPPALNPPADSVAAAPTAAPSYLQTASVSPTDLGFCAQHPQVRASNQCSICDHWMCPTCTFDFPDEILCCPKCAAEPGSTISMHRKVMVHASIALAALSSILMALLCAGLLEEFASQPFGGLILEAAIMLPLCTGAGLAWGSYNKQEGNPAMLWTGGLWNTLGLIAWFAFLTFAVIADFTAS